jgi:hypothetical protein
MSKWSSDDISKLLKATRSRKNINEIAKICGKSNDDVRKYLRKMCRMLSKKGEKAEKISSMTGLSAKFIESSLLDRPPSNKESISIKSPLINHGKLWRPEDDTKFITAMKEGKKICDIAKICGRTPSSIESRKKKVCRLLYSDGNTINKISKSLGLTFNNVRDHIKDGSRTKLQCGSPSETPLNIEDILKVLY